MSKQLKSISWKPVILLLLGAIFGYLSIRASKLTAVTFYGSYTTTKVNLQWVFWLTIGLSVAFLLPLISLVFRELHERNLMPKFLKVMYQQQFRDKLSGVLTVLRVRLQSRVGRIAVLGLAILLIIAIISRTALLREREVNNYLNEGTRDCSVGRGPARRPLLFFRSRFSPMLATGFDTSGIVSRLFMN